MIAESLRPLAVDITTLRLLPGNPRKGDVQAVKRSYERFGQQKPIVALHDGTVIAGNHQLLAARELGWDEIAVNYVEMDEQTAKAFALADNRTADLGTYDDEALAAILAEVSADPDLLLSTGYCEGDLDALIRAASGSDQSELSGDARVYGETYEVVIECDDFQQQETLLLRLSSEGFKVRAIIV